MSDSTAAGLHPSAPHHIPGFLPDAAGNDPLFTVVLIFVIALFLGIGTLYFRLHSLPEQMAHGIGGAQLQLVSILALLALFTHNNVFWILALLLAAVKLPDYLTPLESIADSLKKANDSSDTAPSETASPIEQEEK